MKVLVELHGGSVTAPSEGLGSGAEFEIWLPLASAPAGEPASARRNVDGVARPGPDASLSFAAGARAGRARLTVVPLAYPFLSQNEPTTRGRDNDTGRFAAYRFRDRRTTNIWRG